MRATGILVLAALLGAALLAATASREPFAARVIRLEAAQAAPEMAPLLADESLAVNAVLAGYAERPALRLNAQLALIQYPAMAREVLPLFGGEPEFQDVLARYGPAILPPISYFLRNEVVSLQVLRATGEAVRGAKRIASSLLGGANDRSPPVAETGALTDELTPIERGWYAVGFVSAEGHDFLGQFTLTPDGDVAWVQTERITEAASALLGGGIRSLETKLRQDETPALADYLWAGVDLAVGVGAVKVLRAGRAAGVATGAGSRSAARATLVARTIVRGGQTALRVGRYGVPLAVAYAVLRHPSLISGLAAQAAAVLGWPVPLVQAVVWFLVLLPVLVVARVFLLWVVHPVAAVLGTVSRTLSAREETAPDRTHEPAERIAPTLGNLPPRDPL